MMGILIMFIAILNIIRRSRLTLELRGGGETTQPTPKDAT
jgi:hypothetical protein